MLSQSPTAGNPWAIFQIDVGFTAAQPEILITGLGAAIPRSIVSDKLGNAFLGTAFDGYFSLNLATGVATQIASTAGTQGATGFSYDHDGDTGFYALSAFGIWRFTELDLSDLVNLSPSTAPLVSNTMDVLSVGIQAGTGSF